jgi:YHS domain-containing protein
MEKLYDPVCKMEITPEDAVASSHFNGDIYYFCSTECKEQFEEIPTKYKDHEAAAREGAAA